MKLKETFIIVIATSAASIAARAADTPPANSLHVGDRAIYKTTGTTPGFPSRDDNCTIDTEVKSYDASSQSFSIEQDLHCPNGSTSQTSQATLSTAWTVDRISDLLANCASRNGQLETVTVPAGQFDTCAIPLSSASVNGTQWIGQVPMGLVKSIATSGASNFVVELSSFKDGN